MKKTLSTLLSLVLLFTTVFPYSGTALIVFADEDVSDETSVESAEESEVITAATAEDVFSFPDDMRATCITIGYDFFTDIDQSADVTSEEINDIFSNLESYGFNTIIINTSYDGVIYYEIDAKVYLNGSPLDMLIEAARDHNYYVYITFDLEDAIEANELETVSDRIDYLSQCAHKLTNKYLIDGIIIDGYYADVDENSYENYLRYGSGIGYENWLLDNSEYIFSLVSNAIHSTSNTVAVGLAATNAWMNSDNDSDGSDTNDDFEALADGYSDTKAYIENGYADFVIVTCYGSLDSSDLNFTKIISWWNELAETNSIPMFISHANERISTSDSSWASDQILKQLEECADYSAYQGSVFRSYESLVKNVGKSTDALIKYYDGLIDIDSLYTQLEMVLPTKYNYTTYETTVKFQGTYDSNFDVYFNGEIITLNEAGNFYFEEELEVGTNTFTFQNKADTVTYKIKRNVDVIQSVEPEEGTTMYVEGSTKISVSTVAYSGSTVTATLDGETITLTEQTSGSDDLDENSSYAIFTGYFSAPEGIVGEEQDLGYIYISGNYKNLVYEDVTSAKVIVNAISPTAEATQLVVVKNDNTLAYDYYTTDAIAIPTSPRLPAGTIDVLVNKVTYSVTSEGVSQTVKYYLTASGLRLKASDCTLVDGYTIISNAIASTASYTNSDGDTVLTFNLDYQTPFTISYSPLTFGSGTNGEYSVSSFDPDYVIITFDYVTSYSGLPSFSSDSLFSSAEWQTVTVDGETKIQLKLKLRKSGVFAGYSADYDDAGNLTFTFNGYNSSLAGAVIVVDPGHGYNTSSTTLDPGAVGHVVERVINLAIAKLLVSKLQAAGATVYMIPSDTTYISVYDRSEYARKYDPDLYISIHCNSVTNGEGVRGVETYYFTPFSEPIATLVAEKMAEYYEDYVYQDGKSRNRGAKYNYFAVTLEQEFPSILVECGFVTDYTEAMALNDSTVQSGLADAIVEAIEEYFAANQ